MSRARKCLNPNCSNTAQPNQGMCKACWFTLPRPLRDRIWGTSRCGDRAGNMEAWREAAAFFQNQSHPEVSES